jgi:amino acid transporter/nucleotide-binding universal stress UspA family protein
MPDDQPVGPSGLPATSDAPEKQDARGRGVGTLGPLLAWAVGFADLGTSVYYVPGILFGQVGGVASAFVLITTVAFVLVATEHMEVAHRYPGGGGGVSAAVEAFGVRAGVLSGALMVSAYLLTIAISAVTAVQYLAALYPPWPLQTFVSSMAAILFVGFLSWSGPGMVARLALVVGTATIGVHGWLLVTVVGQLEAGDWIQILRDARALGQLRWTDVATGMAAAWLAYSGLESVGQLAPSVRAPRRKVIRMASTLLIISVLLTVPVFTAVSVEAANLGRIPADQPLLAGLAELYGGRPLLMAVVATAAGLLLLAAKVAFIGCYNIFQAIGEHGYLPAAVGRAHRPGEPPRGAVVVITLGALVLVFGTRAELQPLAQLFAFGLLGSYTITSVSLDVLRFREGRRGVVFALGLVASFALLVPWITSWFTKWKATLYGALATGIMLLVALITHRGWIRPGRFGYLSAASAEASAAELTTALEVLTLEEALALKPSYPSTTLLALRSTNPHLCQEAARRARGVGDSAVYVVYVDEIPGLLFPPRRGPSQEALRVLRAVVDEIRKQEIDAVPVWRLAHDAGASIAEAAEALGTSCVFIGTTQRSAVWHLLQGSVLKRLVAELPEDVHVVICE